MGKPGAEPLRLCASASKTHRSSNVPARTNVHRKNALHAARLSRSNSHALAT